MDLAVTFARFDDPVAGAGAGGDIVDVIAFATQQGVVAGAAHQDVVASTAFESIVPSLAVQFELRLKAADGIARVFYCTGINRDIVMLHCFVKKSQKTPLKELQTAQARMKEIKHADAR